MLGMQLPRLENRPDAYSYATGLELVDLARAYGLTLDPWQQHCLLVASGEDRAGRWEAPAFGLSVARQNGKNAILEARQLGSLVLLPGGRTMIHSAHEVKTALEAFERVTSYFDNYDDLRKLVKAVRRGRGSEAIEMRNGSRLLFSARSRNSLRGFTPDDLFLDEAQHIVPAAVAAIFPSQSAVLNPQRWLTGTPPSPEQHGEAFARHRQAALAGSSQHIWLEWSAEPTLDHNSVEALAQANPSLGIRQSESFADAERADMSDEDFGRERLGKWDSVSTQFVIHPDAWSAQERDLTPDDLEGPVALSVDASPDRSTAAVSIAGHANGSPFVATTEHRSGVTWATAYIASRWERGQVRAVVIDAASPAASLIEPLRATGVLVTVTGSRDYAAACGAFYDSVIDADLTHAGQPALASAVAAARKRKLGDAWAWSRAQAESDITPLVSATLALWALTAEGVAQPKAQARQPRVSRIMYGFN